MATNHLMIKRQVGAALAPVLEPGERIIAGTLAAEGLWPLVMWGTSVLLALAFVVISVIAGQSWPAAPFVVAAAAVSLIFRLRAPNVFVVVTSRRVVCFRMTRFVARLGPVTGTAPVTIAAAAVGRATPIGRMVTLTGLAGPNPAGAGAQLRLTVPRLWRRDLDELLTGLRAGGASVTGGASATGGQITA
jgi:hypothetical protein